MSAFQNYHRQAQPRAVRCCRGRLPERRTAVQRVRPENKILQQEERACPCRDHAAISCAARISRPGNPLERRGSRGEPVELPACPAHRAGVPGGGAERAVFVHDKRVLSGAVCFQGHDCRFCHPRQGRWKPTRPHSASILFVSSENFVRNITDSLALKYTEADSDLSLKKLDMLTLSLTNKNWSKADYQMKPVNNTFAFVDADAATTTILGTEKLPDGKIYPNFLKIKYGKGYVFIHNQPQVFTNHALLSEQSSAGYVAHLLSYIPKDRPVVWFVQGQTLNPNAPKNETGLSVVFRYPALRAVWLLLVYGLLLYIFFNSKRRQRIVPVIKPLRNTTVEFVQTIGNLYYQQGNTANVIDKKIVFFLDRIRTGYFIDTSKLDERFAEKLKSKSEKDIELITEIIDFINEFRKNKTAEKKDLIHINKLIEAFWDKNIKQE